MTFEKEANVTRFTICWKIQWFYMTAMNAKRNSEKFREIQRKAIKRNSPNGIFSTHWPRHTWIISAEISVFSFEWHTADELAKIKVSHHIEMRMSTEEKINRKLQLVQLALPFDHYSFSCLVFCCCCCHSSCTLNWQNKSFYYRLLFEYCCIVDGEEMLRAMGIRFGFCWRMSNEFERIGAFLNDIRSNSDWFGWRFDGRLLISISSVLHSSIGNGMS